MLLADGKQYIVVAIGGGSYSGGYVAFTLPGHSEKRQRRFERVRLVVARGRRRVVSGSFLRRLSMPS
jgi:hypothetical protein